VDNPEAATNTTTRATATTPSIARLTDVDNVDTTSGLRLG
jgi:hypothetical protein